MPPQTAPDALARDLFARGVPLALLLDYDGTLTPIVPTPAEARIDPGVFRRLSQLARAPALKLALVTGRSLDGLEEVAGRPAHVACAVNGGLRIVENGRDWVHPDAARLQPAVTRVRQELEVLQRRWTGSLLEDKGLSLTFHYRRCPDAHDAIAHAVADALRRHPGELRAIEGKQSIELQPHVAWDKGRAALHLLDAWGIAPERAIYLGDDRIDEPAFAALTEHGGLTCRVGPADVESLAEWSLPDVASVHRFLDLVAAALPGAP